MSLPPPRTKRISKHAFLLYGNERLYFKTTTEASFCPARKKKQQTNRSALPSFLNDRHYFTQAFHLPCESQGTLEEQLEDHMRRVRQATQEISEIYFPKPRSKNKYCGVCRTHYEDYKEHVEGSPHLLALTSSPYQLLIVRTCERLALFKQTEDSKAGELSTVDERSQKGIDLLELSTPSKSIVQ